MNKIGIADNLIRGKDIEELIKILDDLLCDECKSKVNSKLANDFVNSLDKNANSTQ